MFRYRQILTNFQNSFNRRLLRKHATYGNRDCCITWRVLLHYLVKAEGLKTPSILVSSTINCCHVTVNRVNRSLRNMNRFLKFFHQQFCKEICNFSWLKFPLCLYCVAVLPCEIKQEKNDVHSLSVKS